MDFNKKSFFIPAVSLFWLLIATLNISQTYLSSFARGWEFIWAEQLIYASGWLLWIIYTPLIFLLVKRNPIVGQVNARFVIRNILIAMGFAMIHCVLDILLQYTLWNSIVSAKPIEEFYGSFYYKYHVNVFVFLFVAGASYTVDYLRRSRQLEVEKASLEALLNEAKLTSLKRQIQPHFLFNTHHNIMALMMKGENDKAISMLTKLSDLLRKTLDLGDQQFVLLKEELGILETYLDIHKTRFSDRLKVNMNIDQSLLDKFFPLMLLQPLIENALQHGIAKSSTAGELSITISQIENHVLIEIQDDGPGCKEIESLEIEQGIGLKTTKSRLKHLFEDDFKMETGNVEPMGFKVTIEIPTIDDNTEND